MAGGLPMPWKDNKVELRLELIERQLRGENISDLSKEYGISRKTAHKFINRFKKAGTEGLKDYSKAPKNIKHRLDLKLEKLILDTKKEHKNWGPKKLKIILTEKYPGLKIPAASTIGRTLKRYGLVEPRRRKRSGHWPASHIYNVKEANQLWSADYKGQFKTGDKRYCYPLTVSDNYSRYILGIDAAQSPSNLEALEFFKELFEEYGLPYAIRTDNGVPFACPSANLGLSKLNVFWLKQGIYLDRIKPGRPEQNGKHERMHLTLKKETTRPARANILQQQECFDDFREEFNQKRPHEAIDMKRPADKYRASERKYNPDIELSYPLDDMTKRVGNCGSLFLKDKAGKRFIIYLSSSLAGEKVGLLQTEEDIFNVYFAKLELGFIDYKTKRMYYNDEWIYR